MVWVGVLLIMMLPAFGPLVFLLLQATSSAPNPTTAFAAGLPESPLQTTGGKTSLVQSPFCWPLTDSPDNAAAASAHKNQAQKEEEQQVKVKLLLEPEEDGKVDFNLDIEVDPDTPGKEPLTTHLEGQVVHYWPL